MGLRDDLKAKIAASEQTREQRAQESRIFMEEEKKKREEEAVAALCHLFSEETVDRIISDHLEKVGGLRVAVLKIRNGPVAMQHGGKAAPYSLTFAADPMTAQGKLADPSVREKLKALAKEGIKVTTDFDMRGNQLTVMLDYRGI